MAAGDRAKHNRGPRLLAIGAAAGPHETPIVARKTAIGSASDNQIVIADKSVSRHHALIRRRMRGYDLIDLESTNGTYVNAKRVTNAVALKRGDELRFGQVRFAFLGAPRIAGARGPGLKIAIPLMILLFVAAFSLTQRWLLRDVRGTIEDSASPAPTRARAALSPTAVSTAGAAAAAAPSRAASSAAPVPTPSGPMPEWLKRLNEYRATAKVAPVADDPGLSAGDTAHVNYLIENLGPMLRNGGNPGIKAHLEDAADPGYTAAGARAGKSSDVDFIAFEGAKLKDPVGWALIDWMSGAFHRLPLLNPRLERVGFSQICDRGLCVAALDAQSGVAPGATGVPYPDPIEFPAGGTTVELRTFTTEWPDPLTSCAGYSAPTGVPITLATGPLMYVMLDAYSFERVSADGDLENLDACGFDSASYTNPDPVTQQTARRVLLAAGAVVVVPRAPLKKGATYSVSMTASGKHYQWSFSIAR
ncbi:MAG TPA: FHA domain-containing protein [Candidatus Binataceae bacterium]|nr:FHA domain-containing protein [Candidatus Binataceae bacterium]